MASQSAQPSAVANSRPDEEHAIDLVASAIALVAGGGARRVTLFMAHREAVMAAAQALSRRLGVVARAVEGPEGSCTIVISPVA
jgi:hypothetical protein